MLCAGLSRSSYWPLSTAQKNSLMARATMIIATGIITYKAAITTFSITARNSFVGTRGAYCIEHHQKRAYRHTQCCPARCHPANGCKRNDESMVQGCPS